MAAFAMPLPRCATLAVLLGAGRAAAQQAAHQVLYTPYVHVTPAPQQAPVPEEAPSSPWAWQLWPVAVFLVLYASIYAAIRHRYADNVAHLQQADRLLCCWRDLYSGKAIWLYNVVFSPVLLLLHACRIYGGSCISAYAMRLFWFVCGPCMGYFVDQEFPPEASSLGEVSGDAANEESGRNGSSVIWVRAMDFCRKDVNARPRHPKLFGTEMCLFQGRIEAQDILQGALGDCWLLAAMATLAEREGAIASLFQTQEVNPRGQYHVKLYDPQEKQWKTIVVDDHVPCERDGRALDGVLRHADGMPQAQYARPHGREIWAVVLEKAFAKLCGSYAAIEAGITEWGIVCMTGGEAWRFESTSRGGNWVRSNMVVIEDHHDKRACRFRPTDESHDADELFDLLRYYHRHGAVLCCGGVTAAGQAHGLVPKHAFSLLQVRTVRAGWETDKYFRFVQIRNPWGTGEWTGQWSDNSPEWDKYPAVAHALGFTKGDDGAYWMQWEDFCQFWGYVGCVDCTLDLHSLRPPMYDETEPTGPLKSCLHGCGEFWCLCAGLRHLLLGHNATSKSLSPLDFEASCGVDPSGLYCNLLEHKACHVENGELVVGGPLQHGPPPSRSAGRAATPSESLDMALPAQHGEQPSRTRPGRSSGRPIMPPLRLGGASPTRHEEEPGRPTEMLRMPSMPPLRLGGASPRRCEEQADRSPYEQTAPPTLYDLRPPTVPNLRLGGA